MGWRCALATAGALALALVAALPARAAKVEWRASGHYEACLEEQAEAWLNAKAEAIVNADESVKALNDAQAAAWTVDAMKVCAGKGASAHPDNDTAFAKYMAHWRAHLYELAKVIRAKGGSD